MKKLLRYGFYLLVFWFNLHLILVSVDGLTDEERKSDVAVILGNKVHESGEVSDRLKGRLEKGLELYEQGYVKRVLVSGGLGKEGHWEATAMAKYLEDRGMPSSDILVDNQGNNTRATAQNFRALCPEAHSLTVVSDFYHISRCKLAFRQNGYAKVRGGHSRHFELLDAYGLFREFFAWYKYLLF